MTRTRGQVVGAAITGAVIGVAGGAALGGAVTAGGWRAGAILGGVGGAVVAAIADATRRPSRPQSLSARVVFSTLLAAAAGSILQWVLPEWSPVVPAVIVGVTAGAAGGRLGKALLGGGVGVAFGLLAAQAPDLGWAVATAATVLVYRLLAAVLWRGREQIRVRAEGLAADEVGFVVPFTEASGYVGVDYLQRYADSVGALFARNPADIGIVASIDDLAGPSFDPTAVHPLVREFYEHTSRFHLNIVPEWKWWMRLPYRIYRNTVARPLGQANAPFEVDEVQRGVVSWIDTIDVDHDGIPDLRAWVRAYEQSNEPLYIGVYTIVRIEEVAYVAVGFPLPAGNFTATLRPFNHRSDGLRLTSEAGDGIAGHYLSVFDDVGSLSTLQLVSFGEQIEVFVVDGELRTEQTFSLGSIPFLVLHYTIGRG